VEVTADGKVGDISDADASFSTVERK